MLFYGNVSITGGQILEVSASIPLKSKVFPAFQKKKKSTEKGFALKGRPWFTMTMR